MPARVVRGEINSSASLARVSLEADLTFRALIVSVDDYGRIDGRLPVLLGVLFPLRSNVTQKKLDKWLGELAEGDDPPILRYVVDGREYIQLTGWEEHRGKSRRAKVSKCPEPHPRKSGRSPEIPGDPPVSRESRVGVESGTGELPSASSTPHTPAGGKSRRKAKTPVPDQLDPDQRAQVVEWAVRQKPPISKDELRYAWGIYLGKARANDYRYVDHVRAFMNALSGERWALRGYEGTGDAAKPKGAAYGDANQMLEERRRAYERESGETVIDNVVDLLAEGMNR